MWAAAHVPQPSLPFNRSHLTSKGPTAVVSGKEPLYSPAEGQTVAMDGGGAALASHAAILRAAAPAALLKGGCEQTAAGWNSCSCSAVYATSAAQPYPDSLPLLAPPAGASLAGAAVQTALLGRLAGSTPLAAFAAVNVVTRPATLLAFSFFVDAAAARLSRALGQRDAATARSQVRIMGVGQLVVAMWKGFV